MQETSLTFLKDLLQTPSPSGFERPVQDIVRAWARPLADEVRTDRHGNVIAVHNPEGQPRIMLAGHCDQIGLMVQHIDDAGFLYVQPIGGWDVQILLGQNLTVWSKSGPITAVIARRAPHLLTSEERNKTPQFTDIWVDIGARDRKEAEELIKPGDPVTLALGYRPLRNGLACSPAMDDKVGVWTVMEALRLLKDRPLKAAIFCVSTVQEEIGLRGATTSAYGIHPAVGIAVDVTHATDTPSNDKKQLGETKLGSGPVVFRGANINPRVFERLEQTAQQHEIAVQVRGAPKATGTDANALQLSREGVATGLVGIPNRYMHSPVEMISLEDLERAARLLAEFCA
ncbi:MAG: M42 family metallopeptidase, partial [Gemmataceae bacterium]